MPGPVDLSARQRKCVYMRSSIFNDEGPSVKNIYNRQNQNQVLKEVEELEAQGHQPPDPAQFAIASPADLRLSQNAGHNAIFGPGTEKCPDVHAVKAAIIPREYWKSDVNLHWADPRNELNRSRMREQTSTGGPAVHSIGDADVTAKERSAFEMSSELFDWERMTNQSTQHPQKELQSCTEHFLANQTDAHKDEDMRAGQRMRMNLNASTASNFTRDTPQSEKAMPNENPQHTDRRRTEKNFSDIFETDMPARAKMTQRSGATDSMSCSWLDARAEVEARQQAFQRPETHFQEQNTMERRLNELQSHVLFGSSEAPVDEDPVQHQRTSEQRKERICWETHTLMEAGSELARREMGHEFGTEDRSAWSRKCKEQSSTSFGAENAVAESTVGQKMQRMTVPAPERQDGRPVSAMDRKQRNLSSNIF